MIQSTMDYMEPAWLRELACVPYNFRGSAQRNFRIASYESYKAEGQPIKIS